MQLHSRVTLSLRDLLSLNSRIFRSLISLILLSVSSLVQASSFNMTPGVTPISREIFELHMTVFWICVAIGVIVFSIMIYTIIAHRKSVGHKAAEFHEHPLLEIIWSLIPFIILIIMAIPATKLLMAMNDDAQAALTINHVAMTQTPSKLFTKDEQMKAGEAAYNNTCAVCHKPDGLGMPPIFPALKGSKVATGPLAIHIHTVLHGVPGTPMQAFGNQLNNEDIAAIITYERNAWGNNTGDVVQPEQIAAARNK